MSVVLVIAFSCGHKSKLIPKEKLSRIHMEMLLADQWLRIGDMNRRAADTTLVYAPIFAKYGYDVDDYRYTVEYYLDQPEEFSKIFDRTTELLKFQLDSLNARERAKFKADSTMRALLAMDIPRPELYSKFFEQMYASDSISLKMDSMHVYRLERIIHDTMYNGPLLVIKEKPVPDSLNAEADSLAKNIADTSRIFPEAPAPVRKVLVKNRIPRKEKDL